MRSVGASRASKGLSDERETHANAYVQLAAELRDCMAFEPKKWRQVLEQSTRVVQGGTGGDATLDSQSEATNALPLDFTQTHSRLQRKAVANSKRKWPQSRDEDDTASGTVETIDETRRVELPSIGSKAAQKRSTAAPTLSQYLNQPHLVDEILRELNQDQRDDPDVEVLREANINDDDDEVSNAPNDTESVSLDATLNENLPARSGFVLPVLSTVSPRTRDGLARLPALTADELRAIDELERLADTGARRQSMYTALQRFGDEQTTPSRGFRHRKMATKRSAEKEAERIRTAKQRMITHSPWKKRMALSEFSMQRAEMIQMALEDVNAQHLQIALRGRFTAHHSKTLSFPVPNGLPSSVRTNLQRDHEKLMGIQQRTAAHAHAAEARLDQTLHDIKQWIPLEIIYEFGLGKFASPAQQRAADLLLRVGQRLKNNLVAQAVAQWKHVVTSEKQLAIAHSTLLLQCWWRQLLALRDVASRRRFRREMERRQRAMLLLLASQENKSACIITRTIRRCGLLRKRETTQRRDEAVRRIQTFWRQQQAAWIALRHHIRQEKRRMAAIALQRITRGVLARRRRRLLERIKLVEKKLTHREEERIKRSSALYRLGAVLMVQRAFRAWVQRRIAVLQRRRARFESDKIKIVLIQAYFRGRRARRWVTNHRKNFQTAIGIIQCAWRCYVARQTKERVKRARRAQRDAKAAAFTERQRLRNARAIALPVNLNKAAWGGLATKSMLSKNGKKDSGPSPREVAAATRIQSLWRGAKLRRRLKHEHAREREMARRRMNRRLREAATCIQRRVRGIQGRCEAWHMMVHHSAAIIQRTWRGFMTRRELFRMRAALKAIMKMQCRWRVRRKREVHAQRHGAAQRIQRGWRRSMSKTWLYKAVRRQQILAEEHAMGIALMTLTRKRVGDDLLVQSFIHHDIQILKTLQDVNTDHDIKSVQRSLYKLDATKKSWKRRGYDGLWQELYRDISGNSFDIDNSHFARFLKALPREFINRRSFPLQTVDLIFAKMKEPKSRTITFTRFNKTMTMVWHDKFMPSSSKQTTLPDQSDAATSAAKKQLEQDHFLKFMHEFVLPSTLQNGKYRKLLERSCVKRLEWAATVLRRFANRITGKQRHHQFVIVYRQHKLEQIRDHAARVLQRHYHVYKFRATLKATLAQMFIEYIDYKGRSVRFEHIETKRSISVTNQRPAFIRGVVCQRIIPLPFPGEEFHAFCERHESATDPHRKVPATVYCVECEDPMCTACFARDHDKRAAFQTHEQRTIALCSHCHVETATRECLQCGDGKVPFCDVCFPFVHKKAEPSQPDRSLDDKIHARKQLHRSRRLVVLCVDCDEKVAQWKCETCEDVFCKRCLSRFHAKGQRQSHPCYRLSYFSILKQKAESKRRAEAQKHHEQKRRERDLRRAEEERVRKVHGASATKVQAWVRSFQMRQKGKAYMKLVRQTNAAKAQRLKDERKRSSVGYKIKSVFGLQPSLKSDTQEETDSRRRRIESIKRTLFFSRDGEDDEEDADAQPTAGDIRAGKPGKKSKPKRKKKRWTKQARAIVEKAATTWLVYGMSVKIVRGGEWKDAVGSILSTQNLFNTGHVVVFIPVANRSVVVGWNEITPYDEDEILRRPYLSPSHAATNAATDYRAKFSTFVDATARRAKLMYLQSIEFHDIVQYAWVVEYNKHEEKEEFWNVVLNRRTFIAPKAMELLERLEGEERDRIDVRVALAKRKLLHLLNPFQPLDKPQLIFRRHAVVAFPALLKSIENDVYTRLRTESEAMGCARFWHDIILLDTHFGGKHAKRFLSACAAAPRNTQLCWNMMTLLRWIELQDTDTFTATAKAFFKKASEIQLYIVNELVEAIEKKKDLNEAQTNLERLLKLKEETIQLLISKAEQGAAAAADKEKT